MINLNKADYMENMATAKPGTQRLRVGFAA
jgi:hypothetical protein